MTPPPSTHTVDLPTVSIGGYGAIVRDMDLETLVRRTCDRQAHVNDLKRELAGELQRLDIERAALVARPWVSE